jgi:hypothetical protein
VALYGWSLRMEMLQIGSPSHEEARIDALMAHLTLVNACCEFQVVCSHHRVRISSNDDVERANIDISQQVSDNMPCF